MDKRLLTVLFAFVLLMYSHSAKTQQLPDSQLTVHEPMILLQDSNQGTLSVVATPNTIPFGGWWPVLTGSAAEGIPWATTSYIVTCFSVTECIGCSTITVDTLLLIPHADSFIGVKAHATTPKKIPGAAEAAGFAGNIHRFTKSQEE